MNMHKEKYEELMLRFGKELHDVGVTENIKKIIEAQYNRSPNVASAKQDECVASFVYQHDGYMIEATKVVQLTVKKCKQ
jgi:hypothetical protein